MDDFLSDLDDDLMDNQMASMQIGNYEKNPMQPPSILDDEDVGESGPKEE